MRAEGGVVLLLSGSSSSGKSTLARALLRQTGEPCALVEADAAYPALNVPPHTAIVVFHRSMAAWSEAGYHLVLDGSLPYDDHDLRRQCLEALPAGRSFVVGVHCDLTELRRRETARPEPRLAGWAERQAADVNDGLDLLLDIDTTSGATDEHARSVWTALRRRHRRPADTPVR
ncbi:phosphotransferase-like protein [Desertihabitans brevis]|uniref:phosphotransferase-like protein n=1 Tax=Desertihabitans brevis TaxID=2268447 RepID=UPI001314F85B|nr:AAA family ATPase [Desertihabitans brevis]